MIVHVLEDEFERFARLARVVAFDSGQVVPALQADVIVVPGRLAVVYVRSCFPQAREPKRPCYRSWGRSFGDERDVNNFRQRPQFQSVEYETRTDKG